jgi:hypothetical protein
MLEVSPELEPSERVKEIAEQHRGIILVVHRPHVVVGESRGAEDVTTLPSTAGPEYTQYTIKTTASPVGIKRIYGKKVPELETMQEQNRYTITDTSRNVARKLEKPGEGISLIPLGSPDHPKEVTDDLLDRYDPLIYATRLAIAQAGHTDWARITYPSRGVSELAIGQFSTLYLDLLTSEEPLGKATSEFALERNVLDYTLPELKNVFYAAGISSREVAEATRKKLSSQQLDTPLAIMKALRAGRYIDDFFDTIS